MIGKFLLNEKWEQYFFSQMYELVKLKIDEAGVKVENEAVIGLKPTSVAMKPKEKKYLYINKPFWIVIK